MAGCVSLGDSQWPREPRGQWGHWLLTPEGAPWIRVLGLGICHDTHKVGALMATHVPWAIKSTVGGLGPLTLWLQ